MKTLANALVGVSLVVAATAGAQAVASAEAVTPQDVGCKLIRNAAQLQAIRNNLAGSYCLANDIDAGAVASFMPIGNSATPFTGKLFGSGWVIRNLRIDSIAPEVGLFGAVDHTLIQDVGLVNVDVTGPTDAFVGGLVGRVLANAGPSEIRRVHVSGRVAVGYDSSGGGIVGFANNLALTDSRSSVSVNASGAAVGGAIGYAIGSAIRRVHAVGPISCAPLGGAAGGLIGIGQEATVDLSYASGPATCGNTGFAGGLVGAALGSTILRSHALGAATAGDNAVVGGLIGGLEGGTLAEVYAIGRVAGGTNSAIGGLAGYTTNTPAVSNAYWDVSTSAIASSAAGAGYTTAALRAALPLGFGSAWAITAKRSYPFLNEADIDFAAPLATLVSRRRVFTFLPIGQRDKSQYATNPAHADAASLAAVYTMIARAIGVTRNIAALKDVKIDKYFWDDAAQTASWAGPVTTRATLGALTPIPANVQISLANVFGEMREGKLVILRGVYSNNGVATTHWMLGTLYTQEPDGALGFVIAHDPWTGVQVMIDRVTKKVVWPASHPLTNFRINGYQPVTVN